MRAASSLSVLVSAALGLVVLGGCSQQASPAGSAVAAGPATAAAGADFIVVPVSCGVRQIYWHGAWWQASVPYVSLNENGMVRQVTGTMTQLGPNQVRFDSRDLQRPETLTLTPNTQANQPPLNDNC